jgi:hypothetical protein
LQKKLQENKGLYKSSVNANFKEENMARTKAQKVADGLRRKLGKKNKGKLPLLVVQVAIRPAPVTFTKKDPLPQHYRY